MTAPTYLVSVCDGSIYMGNSRNNLTLCTNGTNAFASNLPSTLYSPSMQSGPASINDVVEEARFQQHMYFVSGVAYKRLNAHTGEVRDWDAFNGMDLNTNEVRGILPFRADATLNIIDESGGQPVVSGDYAALFEDITDGPAAIQNLGVTQDGFYQIVSATYDMGDDETTIVLSPNPNIVTPSGIISHVVELADLIASYRQRAVMGFTTSNEWFMSAQYDWLNWDYGPAVVNDAQAVAGSLSNAGQAGDNLTALIPFSDDVLLMACENSLWVMRGDPAVGGQLDALSRQVGCVGRDAWAFGPDGSLFIFAATGLYKIDPSASQMAFLSAGVLDTTFAQVNHETNTIRMEYDRARDYLWIFSDGGPSGQSEGWVFDAQVAAFWPIDLPDSNGPTATLYFESDRAEGRTMIIGGRDSFLRGFRDRRANDVETATLVDTEWIGTDVAIESYVLLGPSQLFGLGTWWTLNDTETQLGLNSGPVDIRIYSGPTAEHAIRESSPAVVSEASMSRSRASRQRVSGESIGIEIYQNLLYSTWFFEYCTVTGTPAGRSRRVQQ